MFTRYVTSFLTGLWAAGLTLTAPPSPRRQRPDRGDVPGWVLITVMTAALVVGLWALAGEAFTTFFQDSMDKVRRAG